MQVYGKNGYTAEIPVEIPKKVIAQELVAADGNTTLKDNNLDTTHLLLHGTLAAGVKYIDCQNASNVSKFSVDNVGKITGHDVAVRITALFEPPWQRWTPLLRTYKPM